MSMRQTVVAGQFYPDNAREIEAMFANYNKILDENMNENKLLSIMPRAVIVPHAGYIYSGFSANIAFRLLHNCDINQIVVIGPSHHTYLSSTSVSLYDAYDTPLGSIRINQELGKKLIEKFNLHFQPNAHEEHSTEVQMPFIKEYCKGAMVTELVYGDENPNHLAKVIDFLLDDPKTAVVISTDLSHYYDIKKANNLDAICIDAITTLDTSKLQQGCEACGKIGVEAMLIAANKRGLHPIVLDYRTSADASGDTSGVVGYLSVAFTN